MSAVGIESSGDPEAVAEITEALRAGARAVGEDVEGVVGFFDDDPSTVLFDYLSPGATTLAELRRNAQGLNDARAVDFSYPTIAVRVLSPDVAYSLATSRLVATMADGSTTAVNTRVTDIWHRRDGRWRAVHEHASTPVDVATARALLDGPL